MPDLTENELREKIRELNNKAWSGEMTIAEAKTLNKLKDDLAEIERAKFYSPKW